MVKTQTDPFESFYKPLMDRFREPFKISIDLQKPGGKGVTWWLDMTVGNKVVVAQWSKDMGYGVSLVEGPGVEPLFTHQPDESFKTDQEAIARTIQLLSA
jgi:hypothetical protein